LLRPQCTCSMRCLLLPCACLLRVLPATAPTERQCSGEEAAPAAATTAAAGGTIGGDRGGDDGVGRQTSCDFLSTTAAQYAQQPLPWDAWDAPLLITGAAAAAAATTGPAGSAWAAPFQLLEQLLAGELDHTTVAAGPGASLVLLDGAGASKLTLANFSRGMSADDAVFDTQNSGAGRCGAWRFSTCTAGRMVLCLRGPIGLGFNYVYARARVCVCACARVRACVRASVTPHSPSLACPSGGAVSGGTSCPSAPLAPGCPCTSTGRPGWRWGGVASGGWRTRPSKRRWGAHWRGLPWRAPPSGLLETRRWTATAAGSGARSRRGPWCCCRRVSAAFPPFMVHGLFCLRFTYAMHALVEELESETPCQAGRTPP
jgi:hypothetical protein